MVLIKVLASFIIVCLGLGSVTGQSVTVDTSNLCNTYQYRVSWSGWVQNTTIRVGSDQTSTYLISFVPDTTEGYADWYLLPSTGVNYGARLIEDETGALIAQDTFTAEPCQNLRTYGLEPTLQALVVLNYHRANNSLSPVYYNGLLHAATGLVAAGNASGVAGAFEQLGRSYSGTLNLVNSFGTAFFDAGSLIQDYLLNGQRDLLMGNIQEAGFGYSESRDNWIMAAGRRFSVACGDKFVAGAETCDDGNRDAGDGCASDCTVESGWECATDILQEGSVCTQPPVASPNTSPASSPTSGPTPAVQNRAAVTTQAGTLAILLGLVAIVLSF